MKYVKHATGGDRYLVLKIVVSTTSNPLHLVTSLQTTAHKVASGARSLDRHVHTSNYFENANFVLNTLHWKILVDIAMFEM